MPEKHRFDETCRYEENFTIPDFSRMLDGKVVVLTGGSYGMGKKMAEVMAEHGAKLFITARGQEKLDAAIQDIREKTGAEVTGTTADSSRSADCCRGTDERDP